MSRKIEIWSSCAISASVLWKQTPLFISRLWKCIISFISIDRFIFFSNYRNFETEGDTPEKHKMKSLHLQEMCQSFLSHLFSFQSYGGLILLEQSILLRLPVHEDQIISLRRHLSYKRRAPRTGFFINCY